MTDIKAGALAEVCRLSLVAITLEGAELHMGPADIGADKLAYANSVAARRSPLARPRCGLARPLRCGNSVGFSPLASKQ